MFWLVWSVSCQVNRPVVRWPSHLGFFCFSQSVCLVIFSRWIWFYYYLMDWSSAHLLVEDRFCTLDTLVVYRHDVASIGFYPSRRLSLVTCSIRLKTKKVRFVNFNVEIYRGVLAIGMWWVGWCGWGISSYGMNFIDKSLIGIDFIGTSFTWSPKVTVSSWVWRVVRLEGCCSLSRIRNRGLISGCFSHSDLSGSKCSYTRWLFDLI